MKWAPLGSVVDVSWGNTSITKASYTPSGYAAFSATGRDGLLESFEHDEEGIVLSAIGARCGRCFYAEGKWTAIKNTITITQNGDFRVCIRFLFHYLNAENVWPRKGGGQPFISLESARSLPVPAPSFEEQKRIAAILDKADAIRRKRDQVTELADDFLRSLFLHMFGDPVRNPKDWPVHRFGELLRCPPQIGTIRPASEEGTYPVVRVGEIGQREVCLQRVARVQASESEAHRYALSEGDLLLARAIGSEEHLGKASVFESSGETVLFDSHVMRLRFNQDAVRPNFLREWLSTRGGRANFMRCAGRTAVQFNINGQQIRRVEIPLPPLPLQTKFEQILKATSGSIHKAPSAEILISSLHQRAFRGAL